MPIRESDNQEFEEQLLEFIARKYASGYKTTGKFQLDTVPDCVPDWKVTIEKR